MVFLWISISAMMSNPATTIGDSEGQTSEDVIPLLESAAVALDSSIDYFSPNSGEKPHEFVCFASGNRIDGEKMCQDVGRTAPNAPGKLFGRRTCSEVQAAIVSDPVDPESRFWSNTLNCVCAPTGTLFSSNLLPHVELHQCSRPVEHTRRRQRMLS